MLIDAHAHLDRYADALDSALVEIEQHGIFTVSTAMDLPSYRRAQEIAERCELALPTFGIHPWNAPAYADHLLNLHAAIERSPILGEIGLDFHWVEDASQYVAQRRVVEFFLAAAAEQKKLVNLHTKGAEDEILHLLDYYKIQRAIIHWYSGPLDVFRALVSCGFHFTIGVEVLSSAHIQALARELPLTQLLTETDNPAGAQWLTGHLGMPHLLYDVIHRIAEVKGTTPDAIKQAVHSNFVQLIRDDPWLSDVYARIFAGRPDTMERLHARAKLT